MIDSLDNAKQMIEGDGMTEQDIEHIKTGDLFHGWGCLWRYAGFDKMTGYKTFNEDVKSGDLASQLSIADDGPLLRGTMYPATGNQLSLNLF